MINYTQRQKKNEIKFLFKCFEQNKSLFNSDFDKFYNFMVKLDYQRICYYCLQKNNTDNLRK